jgi:signal transduction histidine kinase
MGSWSERAPTRLAGEARRFFYSLRFRLLALVLLGVIPSVGLILYTAAQQRADTTREVEAGALRTARLVSADQQRLVEDTRQLLTTLSYIPPIRSAEGPECDRILAELLPQYPQYTNLGLAAADGSLLCNGLKPGLSSPSTRLGFIQHSVEAGGFFASGFLIDPFSGQPALSFALPVPDEGGEGQVVIFAIQNLSWLSRLVTTGQLPEDAFLVVVDSSGAVLAHSPGPVNLVGSQVTPGVLFPGLLGSGESTLEMVGQDGINRMFAFARLSGASPSGIFVGVGLSKETASAWVEKALYQHLAGLGLVVLLAMVAAWVGGDLFVVRAVRVLVSATRRLAAGDYRARTGLTQRYGELNQLGRVFDQLGAVLEQREIEHQHAETVIRRQLRDLSALNTIAATVSSSLELLEVLESLKRLLAEQFDVPGGAIFSYDEAAQSLKLEAAWGVPAAVLAGLKSLPASLYHYPRVLEGRAVYLQPDFRQVEPYASSGLDDSRPNLQSFLCIPLTAQGRVRGVVDMFSRAPHSFSGDQVNLFAVMGQEVGVALQNASFYEEVKASRGRLRLLSQQLIEVQENERRHIARELHDEIGQALTAVKVNLQTIGLLASDPAQPAVQGRSSTPYLRESIAIIDRTIHQIRNLSLDLRPSLLDDLGVVSALRWYVDRQAQRAGFEASFTAHPTSMRFSPTLETTCFRVVQEALTNVVRHSKADRVSVSIEHTQDSLEIHVFDNGIGFDLAEVQAEQPVGESLGLLGMKERVELVGGSLEINSSRLSGTHICAVLPVPDSNKEAEG